MSGLAFLPGHVIAPVCIGLAYVDKVDELDAPSVIRMPICAGVLAAIAHARRETALTKARYEIDLSGHLEMLELGDIVEEPSGAGNVLAFCRHGSVRPVSFTLVSNVGPSNGGDVQAYCVVHDSTGSIGLVDVSGRKLWARSRPENAPLVLANYLKVMTDDAGHLPELIPIAVELANDLEFGGARADAAGPVLRALCGTYRDQMARELTAESVVMLPQVFEILTSLLREAQLNLGASAAPAAIGSPDTTRKRL